MTNKIAVLALMGVGFAAFGGLFPEPSRKLMALTGVSVPSQAAETRAAKGYAPAMDARGHAHDGEEDKGGEDGRIHRSDEPVKTARLGTAPATARAWSRSVTMPGTITANAGRLAHVTATVPGTLKEIRKRLGEPVKEGEVIAILESRDIAEAKSEYLAAMQSEHLAREVHAREKTLWEKRISAQQDFLEARMRAETAGIRLDVARQRLEAFGLHDSEIRALPKQPGNDLGIHKIRAPISGHVVGRQAGLGSFVDAKANIFVVAELSTVWVQLIVPPDDLPFLKEGQRIAVADSTGTEVQGEIVFVNPMIDAETRTARAVAQLPNPDRAWRPGEFVTARFQAGSRPPDVAGSQGEMRSNRHPANM